MIRRKRDIKIKFIPIDGDVTEIVINALEPRVSLVLERNGFKMSTTQIKELMRKHARSNDEQNH